MAGSIWEALPDVWEWLGDPPSCPGVVRVPPGYPGVVRKPSRTFQRPARRSGNGRDTLLDVPIGWEALPDVGKLLVILPDVRRPSRLSGSGRVALPVVREWSGGPPGCPGVVGWPSRISESGRETLPNAREWWEAFPDVQEDSWMSRSGQEVFPDVKE